MKKWLVDVEMFETVQIEADTQEEAEDLAYEMFREDPGLFDVSFWAEPYNEKKDKDLD